MSTTVQYFAEISSNASSHKVWGKYATGYVNSWTAATGDVEHTFQYGQYGAGEPWAIGDFNIMRAMLLFDTTAFPSGKNILSSKIYLGNVSEVIPGSSPFITVLQCARPVLNGGIIPNQPSINTDFNRLNYVASGYENCGEAAYVDILANGIINLNATGFDAIVPGGWTTFIMRADTDINGLEPAAGQYQLLEFQPEIFGPIVVSYLEIEYDEPGPGPEPSIGKNQNFIFIG